ncbi:MAG: hypothetical protein LiPW41_535 [Parcubacteria group bacterium LiPW_41]|nr:MAG: hypothetical protein LiPW41_535 [Parcubacteria group bacterium LiPW_41]
MEIKLREVTTLSKILAMIVFIAFPIIAFFLGIQYQKLVDYTDKGPISISVQNKSREFVKKDFALNGNNCYDMANYFVIVRANPQSAGEDILVKYKLDKNQNIPCDYSLEETDFEIKNTCNDGPLCYRAQHLSGVFDNLLVIDEGTSPENRGLIVYDLIKKSMVFSDTYNSSDNSLDPQGDIISYWHSTKDIANDQNCPKIKEYQSLGGGAKIETKISLDLLSLARKELGETRCSYSQ